MKNLISFLLLFPCCFTFAMPQNITTTPNSYIPRAYLRGDAGTTELGEADIVAPLWQGTNSNLFAYGQGRYSYAKQAWGKNPWTGSLGLGYRQLVANSVILGAYVLGDYMKTLTNHNLKQVSPGIELLSRTWDFRANGYFPLGKKKWSIAGWADTFGDYSHISFSGHTQYDAWYIFSEEAGIGVDAEIGRKLFDMHHVLVKGYVVGYFFNMSEREDVKGLGARVTIQPNTYIELSLNDDYDNYSRNVFTAGLRVSLYDLFNGKSTKLDSNNLNWRLFTPIERNFAEVGFGDDTRITGGPQDGGAPGPAPGPGPGPTPPEWNGHTTPERTNVWFFEPGLFTATKTSNSVSGNGTYEHPYTSSQFNQVTVNEINAQAPNALLYFTGPGARYNAYTAGTPSAPITIQNGQSLWGRMGDNKGYQMPATGSNRPIFVGALKLNGNNELDSLRLENDKALTGFTTGITMNGAANVILNNDEIGTSTPTMDDNPSYQIGVYMENGSDLTISNSDIYGYYNGASFAAGVQVFNGTNQITKIENSQMVGTSTGAYGYGFVATSDSTPIVIGNISGSSFSGNGPASAMGFSAVSNSGELIIGDIYNSHFTGGNSDVSIGFNATVNAVSDVSIGAISGSTFKGDSSGSGYGLFASAPGGKVTVGDITNGSTFDGDGAATAGAGFYANALGDIKTGNIIDSTFTGNSTNSFAFGFAVNSTSGAGTITMGDLSASSFTASGVSGYGFSAESGSGNITIGNISNGSSFDGTGSGAYGYGFFAKVNSGAGAITIGSLADSEFTGDGVADSAGFSANTASGDITIGNITNVSKLDGTSTNGNGYGLFAKVDSGAGKIQIGDISGSTFSGVGDDNTTNFKQGYGLYVKNVSGAIAIGDINDSSSFYGYARQGYGLYLISTSGFLTLKGISSSTFEGRGVVSSGGFAASDTNGNIDIGDITDGSVFKADWGAFSASSNNGSLTIGNIINSEFTGKNSDDPTTNSTRGTGFTAYGGIALNIGNISNSTFTGKGDIGTGFSVGSSAGTITIGDIEDGSTFTGIGTKSYGYGFHAKSTSGTLNIAKITSSTFNSEATTTTALSPFAYGFFVEAQNPSTTAITVNIGDIDNSEFDASKAPNDYGFYVLNDSGTVNIGTIGDSTFIATADASATPYAYGFKINHSKTSPGTIVITDITNSTFSGVASYLHKAVELNGSAVSVGTWSLATGGTAATLHTKLNVGTGHTTGDITVNYDTYP